MSRLLLGTLALLLAGCHLIFPFNVGEGQDVGPLDGGFTDAAHDVLQDLPQNDRGPDVYAAVDGTAKQDTLGSFNFPVALGGPGFDKLKAITVDPSGNLYLAGGHASAAKFGTLQLPAAAKQDAIVISLTPKGKLRWFKSFGGAGEDLAHGIAFWGGRVFVTGVFVGQVNSGGITLSGKNQGDVFVVGLGEQSGGVHFARALKGSAHDIGWDVAADNLRVCVVGQGAALEDDAGVNYPTAGGYDGFAALYNTSGQLSWVRRIGGSEADLAYGAALDSAGNCVVGGSFSGTIALDGTHTATSPTHPDAFVARLSATNQILSSVAFGSSLGDSVHSIVYQGKDIVVTGHYTGATSGVVSLPKPAGYSDIFVAKLDPGLTKAHWARSLGSTGTDVARHVAIDGAGRVVLAGQVQGAVTHAVGKYAPVGVGDAVIARYSATGALQWVTGIGAPSKYSEAFGVVGVGASTYYLVGRFDGQLKGLPLTSAGGTDGFLVRFDKI